MKVKRNEKGRVVIKLSEAEAETLREALYVFDFEEERFGPFAKDLEFELGANGVAPLDLWDTKSEVRVTGPVRD